MRAVRGAIVVPEDSREAILNATARLVETMMERNSLTTADLVSVIFTATPDLRSAFPAAAARQMGLTDVPLLCAAEIDVEGALGRVVRVLVHARTEAQPVHVYLDGAESLRDDL